MTSIDGLANAQHNRSMLRPVVILRLEAAIGELDPDHIKISGDGTAKGVQPHLNGVCRVQLYKYHTGITVDIHHQPPPYKK